MKKNIKFIVVIILFVSKPQQLYAENYEEYKYSNTKDNGIEYEVDKMALDDKGVSLEGWAYINDTQHYIDTTDIETTIMVYESGGQKSFFPAKINKNYDLTDIEFYQGRPFCSTNQINKPPETCNYKYKAVGFSATIPLNIFKYGHTYDFYIYVDAKTSGKKMYTKLYADSNELSYKNGNYTYELKSNLEISNLKINNHNVLVRTTPGKNGNLLHQNNKNFYYKPYTEYDYIKGTYIYPTTWYQVGVVKTQEVEGPCYLVNPGSKEKVWVASNYVDYAGSGNLQLNVVSNTDVKISSVMSETISKNHSKVEVEIAEQNVSNEMQANIVMQYGDYAQNKVINLTGENQKISFEIPNEKIKQGLTISFLVEPYNYTYSDKNKENNYYETSLLYPSNKNVEINAIDQESTFKIESYSGFYQKVGGSKKYYDEIISITIPGNIKNIPRKLNGFDVDFPGFYAGGAFDFPIKMQIENEFPNSTYKYDIQEYKPVLSINSDYLKKGKNDVDYTYEFDEGIFKFHKIYINESGILSNNKLDDAIYPEGKRVLYTSIDLRPGIYPFEINTQKVGVNNQNIKIKSYIKITGKLFGNNKNDLFYVRNALRNNPMPNYDSILWKEELKKGIDLKEDSEYTCINIDTVAREKMRSYIMEDFNNNLLNNDNYKKLYQQLIDDKHIEEKKCDGI